MIIKSRILLVLLVGLLIVPHVVSAQDGLEVVDDTATTDEDTPVDIPVLDNDADGLLLPDPATVEIVAPPADGMAEVDKVSGIITYTPDMDFFGMDEFSYQVCDDVLGTDCGIAIVTVTVDPVNDPPDCSAATADIGSIWPPNHKMAGVGILGVTDVENDPITITILGATSDEPENGTGDGNTAPDADSSGVRAERSGNGDGRVYMVEFQADDGNGGTCMGTVNVEVPHDQRDHAANNAAVPGAQPGDFGCDHPGNYCNAPGHNKGGDSSPAPATSQQQNNHSNKGGNQGNNGNNGNHGNGNNASAKSQGHGPKK